MPGSSEGLTTSPFEQIKITAVKLSRYKAQVTGLGSQIIVLPMQKQPEPFTNANISPENFCLGLIRPKVSFNGCLGYVVLAK